MRGLARFMDARNTAEGKFLSVLLSLLLVFSFLNITMFTDLANAEEDEAVAQSEELQEAADEAGDKKTEEPEEPDSEPEGESGEVETSDPEGVVAVDDASDEAPGSDATTEDAEDSVVAPVSPNVRSDTGDNPADINRTGNSVANDGEATPVTTPEDKASGGEPSAGKAAKTSSNKAPRAQSTPQDVYCYALRPGGDATSNNPNANWLGMAKVTVETQSPSDFNIGEKRPLKIAYPTSLPSIDLNGKAYQYAAPGSGYETTAGYYTVKWNAYISVCNGANVGFNKFFPEEVPNGTKTYHLDGIASINDTNKFNVGFEVRYPQKREFELITSTYKLVEEGTSYAALVKPQAGDVPPVKYDDDGIQYRFDGWYTDEQCTNRVDEDSFKVTRQTSLYGRYVKSEAKYTVRHVREGVGTQAEEVETDELNGFVGADTKAVAKEYDGFISEEFIQKKITEDGTTVVEIRYARMQSNVTYRFTGDVPANQAPPRVFSHKYGEVVSVESAPKADGYLFEGWVAPSTVSVQNGMFTMPNESVELVGNWKRDTERFSIAPYEGVYNGHAHVPSFAGYLVEGEKLEYAAETSSLTPSSDGLDWKSAEGLSLIHVADSAKSVFVRVVNGAGGVVWQSVAGAAVAIKPRPVIMVLPDQTKTYDGSNRLTNNALTFTEEKDQGNDAGILSGEEITASLNTQGSAAVTYSFASVHDNEPLLVNGVVADVIPSEMVTVSGLGKTNLDDYAITLKPGNGTISRSTEIDSKLDVVFEGKEKLYDGKPMEIDPAIVSPGNEDVTVKYALQSARGGEGEWVSNPSELNIVDAGSYIVVAKVTSPNYEGSKEVRATFTINKRALKLVGESRSGLVYDGIEHHFTDVTAKDNGYADGQYANVTYSVAGTDAGEYTGAFSPASAADVKVYKRTGQDVTHNYTIELIPGTLTIEKASGNRVFAVNFADAKAQTLVYDGQPHEVTATAVQPGSTIEYTQTPEIETSWSSVPPRFENAGTYEVFVRATHPNYITTPSVKATLVIQKRAVAITGASLESKEYDGVESSTTDYKVEAENGDRGLVKRAKVEGVNYELKGTDAGTYQGDFSRSFIQIKTATGEVLNRNYRVELVRGALEITKRPYTVTTGSATKSYDGAALTNNEVVVAGLVEGETVDVRTTGSITEVGSADNTYTLTWTGTANEDNYEFDGHTLGKLEVVEAEYGIEVHGYVGPYDGTDHGVAVEAPEGATVTFSTDNVYRDVTDGAVEVAYTITRPNYRTITGAAVIQINPRPVTITVNSASKFVGAADPALTGTIEGVVEGETLGVTYARANTDEAAGIYRGALTAFYAENPNYAVTVVPGTFTILPTVPIPGTPAGATPDPEPTTPAPTTPTVTTVPTPTLPTPAPAAATPTPAPAAATPTTVVTPAVPAAAEPAAPVVTPEAIDDDATPQAAAPGERTPLAETEEIADEETPMGAFDEPHCWVHWVMLLGIVLTAIYAVVVVRRRLSLTDDIDDYEDQILGRVRDSESVPAHAASRQAL